MWLTYYYSFFIVAGNYDERITDPITGELLVVLVYLLVKLIFYNELF